MGPADALRRVHRGGRLVVRAAAPQGRVRRGAGAVAIAGLPAVRAPEEPYRGIEPFRFEDHAIFFARDEETRLLASLVVVYRGALLYGASGNGKSSLVNAGLLPQAHELGFVPVRVRVQPRPGAELVVDQIDVTGEDGATRDVVSIEEFEERLAAVAEGEDEDEARPLIVFDQFEEILTLFEDGDAIAVRLDITAMITRLLRGTLPVKLLFAFREDYLGGITELLHDHPELVDQALRLGPPVAGDLAKIIRGPFERFPGHFRRELAPELAERLSAQLAQRFGTGEVSLSEVQTVCLRLWRSPDPDALLEQKGVQGLLEDELGEALAAFEPDTRAAAVALLSEMVTADGTRNVISAEDLRLRVREAGEDFPPDVLDEALRRLEGESKLVRRERRRDIYLYEITSEFLVPWISRRREEARLEKERRRERRRLRVLGAIAGGLLFLVAIMAAATVWALHQRSEAERQTREASALALVASSQEAQATRPDVALALAYEAHRRRARPEAASAVIRSLLAARKSGVRSVLTAPDVVYTVAYSPDGRVLAYAGYDGPIRLVDRAGRQVAVLAGHKGRVEHLAFSPDGRTLASAGDDGTVRLWDPATHEPVARLRGHEGAVLAVSFAPDGKTLASGGEDGARIWDVATHQRAASVPHTGGATDVAFSPDGRTLALTDESGVGLWNVGGPGPPRRLDAPGALNIAFSPDGKRLATAGPGRAIRVLDIAGGETHVLTGHKRDVLDVAFSPDGKTLASASDDRTVRLWDPTRRTMLAVLKGHSFQVSAVAFSPDGRTLASAGVDATVRLWNTATRADSGRLAHSDRGTVWAAAFSPDGKTLASGGDDGVVRLWNPRSSQPLGRLPPARAAIFEVAVSPDGAMLAYGAADGIVRLRSTAPGHKRLGHLVAHKGDVNALAFSPDGRVLASAGADKKIRLVNPVTHDSVGALVGHKSDVYDIAFSPDGKTLASASLDGTVRLWDVAHAKEIHRWKDPTGQVFAVAFSPDGQTLAYAPYDPTIRLLDVRTRKPFGHRLVGHRDAVNALVFSPDGKTLASASDDGTVRLWDPAQQKPLARLEGHRGLVEAVAFSPDGRMLASAGDDHTVRLWREILWRSPAELTRSVCDVLLHGVSRADWDQYAADVPYRQSCR